MTGNSTCALNRKVKCTNAGSRSRLRAARSATCQTGRYAGIGHVPMLADRAGSGRTARSGQSGNIRPGIHRILAGAGSAYLSAHNYIGRRIKHANARISATTFIVGAECVGIRGLVRGAEGRPIDVLGIHARLPRVSRGVQVEIRVDGLSIVQGTPIIVRTAGSPVRKEIVFRFSFAELPRTQERVWPTPSPFTAFSAGAVLMSMGNGQGESDTGLLE
jgi:hypothetical protein